MDNIIEIRAVSFLDKIMPTADFPPKENRGLLHKNSALCFQVAIKNKQILISLSNESKLDLYPGHGDILCTK